MEKEIPKNWVVYFITINAVLIFFAILLLRTAWLCDDSYISFRTVDNVVNGYGLRWNVNERVQAYTHPLWLFLHIPFYFLTREMFLTPIFISFTVSMLVIILLIFVIAENTSQILIATSILGFSRAFIDFSSSGLENPMSHLLLILFFILFVQRKFTFANLFLLSLIACLATLNRQDCILFYIPPLIYTWWNTDYKKTGILLITAGFIPLFLWEIFSLVYYGFPFPNTAYAKLGAGIPRFDLILQGLKYYRWTCKQDFITLLALFIAFVLPFYRRKKEVWVWFLGLLSYCIYIVWIGGDFMGGRFFTVPLLLATMLILRYSRLHRIKQGLPVSAIFIITSLTQPFVPIFTGADFSKGGFITFDGITTERKFYFGWSSLANWERGKPMPSFNWANEGREYREKNQRMAKVHGCIGYRGFFAGPLVHIIDYHGLADPLLARMPALYHPKIAIGHFKRYVPEGYADSVDCELNYIQDKALAEFYDKIRIITRGPLWSWQRFAVILKMNLGYYNYLIDEDRYRFADAKVKLYEEWKEELEKLPEDQGITIPERGLEIRLNKPVYNSCIEMELRRWEKYHILFYNGKNFLARVIVGPDFVDTIFVPHPIKVPKPVIKSGYDKLRIFVYPLKPFTKIVTSEIRNIRLLNE